MANRNTAKQKIMDMPNLKVDDFACTPLATRPTVSQYGVCFLCKEQDSPEKEIFIARQNAFWKKKDSMEDKLLSCGGGHGKKNKCRNKFHLSCIMLARPIPRYNPQYLGLKKVMGSISCHDHGCSSCLTDGFQGSAHHGELTKDISLVRAYHKECQPAGSRTIVRNRKVFFELAKQEKFNGVHMPICYACIDTVSGGLTKCETCVQSFHHGCHKSHRVDDNEEKKQCEDCMFQTQKRLGEGVLVEVQRVFRAARIMEDVPAETGKVVVKLLSDEETIVVAPNTLFRPYGCFVDLLFFAMQKIGMYSNNIEEFEYVKEIFLERVKFFPSTPPLPDYTNNYDFHPSVNSFLPKQRLSARYETYPGIEIKESPGLGNGMFLTEDVAKGTVIGEYSGEIISEGESDRRMDLGGSTCDKQCKFYCFYTNFETAKGNPIKLVIDGACTGNETRMINHSCTPNCTAVPTEVEVKGGVLTILVIKTNERLTAGIELTINYNWPKKVFKCLCEKCVRVRAEKEREEEEQEEEELAEEEQAEEEQVKKVQAKKKQVRKIKRVEKENDENDQENEEGEGSSNGKKKLGKRGVAKRQKKQN